MRLLLLAALVALASPSFAQTGTLDPAFGTGGRVVLDPSGTLESGASAAALLPDGRILLAGRVEGDAAILRLNAEGTLDAAYGVNGIRLVDLGGANDAFTDIVALPDGSVVAVGAEAAQDDEAIGGALVRLTPGGALDASFGTGGLVDEAGRNVVLFTSLARRPDGRLVAVGQTGGDDGQFVAAGYTADGTPDPAFGTNGFSTPALGDAQTATFPRLALDAEGRLVVGAWVFPTDAPFDAAFGAFRLTPAGALDTTFGGDGTVITDFGTTFDVPLAIATDADGRITLGGQSGSLFTGTSAIALVRYTENGDLDTGFGTNGVVQTSAFGAVAAAFDLVYQSDGKLLVGGAAGTNAGSNFLLARFTGAGALDAGFGTGGRTLVDFGAADIANGLAFDSEGRLLLVGETGSESAGTSSIALARIVTDGRPSAGEAPAGTEAFSLDSSPNPFGNAAAISLTLDAPGDARVSVFDAIGRRVALLQDGVLGAGTHTFRLAGTGLAPGLYVVRAEGTTGGATLRIVRR